MKNKNFLKKLAAVTLGFVMTLGVGAAGYAGAASETKADPAVGTTTYTFSLTDFGITGNSYSKKTHTYSDGVTISLSGSKQNSNITDIPVTKGAEPVILVLPENTQRKITSYTFKTRKWGSKNNAATGHYSVDGGSSYTSSGTSANSGDDLSISCADGTNAIKVTFNGTSNQVGLVGLVVTYAEASASQDKIQANSVTISGNSSSLSNKVVGSATENLTATVTYQSGEGYKEGSGQVTWSSSDSEVASVASDGVVTFAKTSLTTSVTITATAKDKGADGATISKSVSYNVSELIGYTQNNPMSISQALTEANKLGSGKNNGYNVFATGKISDTPSNNNGRYSFTIADLTTSSTTIKGYSLNYDGASSNVVQGATVVVEGYLINYSGTKEIGYASGATSQIISIVAAASISVVGGDQTVNLVNGGASSTDVKYTKTGDGTLSSEYVGGSGNVDCANLSLANGTVTISPKAVGTGKYKLKIGSTLSTNIITVVVAEPHECTPSDTYEKTASEHYLVCSECGAEIPNSRGSHSADGTGWHTADGDETHWHICSVCGYHMDAANHDWDDGEVITEPTKTQPGTTRYTCNTCLTTKDVEVPYVAPEDPLDGYYAKVTDFSTLKDKDHIIVTNAVLDSTDGSMLTISEQYSANNRKQVKVIPNSSEQIQVARNLTDTSVYNGLQLTLEEGTNEGYFKIRANYYAYSETDSSKRSDNDKNKKYFHTAYTGTSNNLLVTEYNSEYNDNFEFKFSTSTDGNACVQAKGGSRTYLRHNPGSSIFSCYGSESDSQTNADIFVYKQVPPTYIESISFNDTTKVLDTDSGLWTPTVTITPENPSSSEYELQIVSCSPSGAITVNGKSVVAGSVPGTAVIKAAALDGSEVESTNTCTITVSAPREPLDAPTGFAYSNGYLTWNVVDNASGYKISIDEGAEQSATSPFSVSSLELGPHTASLYAVGGSSYSDSEKVSVSWDTTPDTISAIENSKTLKLSGGTYNLSENVVTTGTGALSFTATSSEFFTIDGNTLTPVKVGGPVTITGHKGSETCTFTVSIISYDNSAELEIGDYMIAYNDGQSLHYASGISSGKFTTSTSSASAYIFHFDLVGDDEWYVTKDNTYLSITNSSTGISLASTATKLNIYIYDDKVNPKTRVIESYDTHQRALAWYSNDSSLRTYNNSTSDYGMTLVKVSSYKVNFDSNGGSGSMEPLSKRDGLSVNIPTCSFTAPVQTPALEFDCWKVTVDASGTLLNKTFKTTDSAFTMPANDITLQAQWVVHRTQLSTPTNISYSGGTLTWDAVDNATGYMIKLDETGDFEEISTNSYSVSHLESYSDHSVQIYAISTNELYKDSEIASNNFTTDPKALPNGNYILVISTSGEVQYFNADSYKANDKTHKATVTNTLGTGSGDVLFTSSNVMKQGGGIQLKGGSGYFYNENSLGTIKSINYSEITSTPNIYIGSEKEPSSTGTGGYFKIKASSNLTVIDDIVIKFTIGPDEAHSLNYNANEGSGTLPNSESLTWASTATVGSGSGLLRTGYTFAGWNTAADGSGTSYAAGDIFEMGDDNTTLYAQWTAKEYSVVYNANGGSGVPTDSTKYHIGDTVMVDSTTIPTKANCKFDGWSLTQGGEKVTSFEIDENTSSTTNLYARWLQKYSVSCKLYTGVDDIVLGNYAPGEEFTLPETPTRDGFTFAGWSYNSDTYEAGEKVTMPEVTSGITFKAIWHSNGMDYAEDMSVSANPSFYYNQIDDQITVSNLKLRFSTELSEDYIDLENSGRFTYGMILVKTSDLEELDCDLDEAFETAEFTPSLLKELCPSVKKASWTSLPSLNSSGNYEFGGTLSFKDLTDTTSMGESWTCLWYVYDNVEMKYIVTESTSASLTEILQRMINDPSTDKNLISVLEFILNGGKAE